MRKFNVVAVLLLSGAVAVTVFGVVGMRQAFKTRSAGEELSPPSLKKMNTPIADIETRQSVSDVNTEDVASLRFYGPQMGCFADDPIIVVEPQINELFLRSLRNAQTRVLGLGNRMNILEIHFEKGRRPDREPLVFRFNPTSSLDSYGTDFQNALRVLGRHQAKRVRETVTIVKPQVRAVQIVSTKISDVREVQRLLKALQDIDERAFAYTEPGSIRFPSCDLILKDGKATSLNLVPEKISGRDKIAPLPEPLWEYYSAKNQRHTSQVKSPA